jgi:hypothetical protein
MAVGRKAVSDTVSEEGHEGAKVWHLVRSPDSVRSPPVQVVVAGMVDNGVMTPMVARALGAILVAAVAIASTGGLSAVGFWATIVADYLSVIVASVGLGVALVPVLPLIPVGRMIRRAFPAWGKRLDLAIRAVVALIPGTLYFLWGEPVAAGVARLPSEDPRLGAVMVIVGAALAYTGIHLLSAQLAVPERFPKPRPSSGPTPWRVTAQEPAEEFWSPDPVAAWRTWKWNGRVLKGSFERDWPSDLMEADCVVCSEPPGWDCPCGIYAMKDHRPLPVVRPGSAIIGKVALSGRVIEHEEGYRGSHARITDLWVDDPLAARWIALTYPEVRVWLGSPPEETLVPPV